MTDSFTRRDFLHSSAAAVVMLSPAVAALGRSADKPIRVVVWDEQQPQQKDAYDDFIGNLLAKYLGSRPGLTTRSVKLSDPEQGLAAEVLNDCDILMWWGHVKNSEVKPEVGKKIAERIKAGDFSFVALHSAHWSSPFVEAMNERTRLDVQRQFPGVDGEKVEITYVDPPKRFTVPKADERVTPFVEVRKFPEGVTKVTAHLPYCCFPAYRADGKPSTVKVLMPNHPLAKGLPKEFSIPHTEMYDSPFHIPEPDERILEKRWESGEWFPSGSVWNLGKGRVFYFRPGHETFAVYREENVLKLLENAVRWLGTKAG